MRFRPLRPASAPEAPLAPVAEPPADDAGRRHRRPGRARTRCARGIRPRPLPRPERAARARRRRRDQPDRRQDARGRRRVGCDRRRTRRRSATTSAASWCGRPYEAHPLPARRPRCSAWRRSRARAAATPSTLVVPSLSVARKPASLSHVEAAGVPLAALTAWGLVVETAHAHEGQRMLIHAGSGGVGHFAVQFAAYFGAHVTATGSARNASWLRELGRRRSSSTTPRPGSRRSSPTSTS